MVLKRKGRMGRIDEESFDELTYEPATLGQLELLPPFTIAVGTPHLHGEFNFTGSEGFLPSPVFFVLEVG